MTADALRGLATTTYPGGTSERDASLAAFDRATVDEARQRFVAASAALGHAWRELDDRQWATVISDRRIGPMALGRLVALRLTELEVHHVDLDLGYRVADWPPGFPRTCLPLHVAWLGSRHRTGAVGTGHPDRRWLLEPTDDSVRWLVTVRAREVLCQPATPSSDADVTVTGTSAGLLAFLLGRRPEPPLDIRGNHGVADSFKQVFPGP